MRWIRRWTFLLLAIAWAVAAAAADDGIDWARAKQLHERAQKGEKLSAEDQAYYDKVRAVLRKLGDKPPGAGNKPLDRPADDQDIDWKRAQELHRRFVNGEKLTPEEQAYHDRAAAALKRGGGAGRGTPLEPKETYGLPPLTELGSESYKGQTGGLYGNGQNEPPPAHREAAAKETAKIQPLDKDGKPADDGKIVLMSIGMSNTTQEFSMFQSIADRDPDKSPKLTIVDAAQGGQASIEWANDTGPDAHVWGRAEMRLGRAGVTPQQVQVLWIKQAIKGQGQYGEFPAHAQRLKSDLVKILNIAHERYPNLRVAYLSSRIYGGYTTGSLNPEPYAYEGAYAVRWLIESQIKGDAELNHDAARGKVVAPIALWGPYLWGDGMKPRKADGLVWKREDFAGDGTHPSDSGRRKVADLLLAFFKTDPQAKTWFVK